MRGLEKPDSTYDGDRILGWLLLGVRQDSVPTTDADRLAADGGLHPLTVNENGFLKVVTPSAEDGESEAQVSEPTVRELLAETNSLLRRLVLSMELLHGAEINDPQN